MLDENDDQIYDAVSLEPEGGPTVVVSIEIRDIDADGRADFATLPWNLTQLLGVRATNEEVLPQPFIPLADTNDDGIPDSPAFDFEFIAPVDVRVANLIDTGIAIRNVRTSTRVIGLSLFDATGTLAATTTLEVPVQGHDARFLSQSEWIPEPGVELDFSSFRGLIKATAKRGITGTVLQVRGGAQFATMPTSPILN